MEDEEMVGEEEHPPWDTVADRGIPIYREKDTGANKILYEPRHVDVPPIGPKHRSGKNKWFPHWGYRGEHRAWKEPN